MTCASNAVDLREATCKRPRFLHTDSEDWADAKADLSFRWAAHVIVWFCYAAAHMLFVRRDLVSLGGIRQKNNFSKEVDPEDTKGILERCYKLWPSLKVG